MIEHLSNLETKLVEPGLPVDNEDNDDDSDDGDDDFEEE